MRAKPSCDCGGCDRCKQRAYTARFRAKWKGWQSGRGLPEPRAARAPGVPVDTKALDYLSELRALAGPGAVVGIGSYGVMIDTTTERRTWPTLDDCLAELTATQPH